MGKCACCDKDAITVINGMGACKEHIEQVIDAAFTPLNRALGNASVKR